MQVRKGLLKDLAFVVQSQLDMAMETENLKLDEQTLLKGVRAVFEDSNRGQYWIVEKADEAIGMCLTVPEWSDWRNGTVVWIHSVYVVPSARGTGVYRYLHYYLKEMIERNPALRGLRLYVDKRNANAMKVYEKVGMNADHYALYEWLKD